MYPPRMRGIVEKCSFCFHRYQAPERRPIRGAARNWKKRISDGLHPGLSGGAIIFGDLNNPEHQVAPDCQAESARKVAGPRTLKLSACWKSLGTNTKVYYLSSKQWVRRTLSTITASVLDQKEAAPL
jgi:Fe-S-cluster-containing dehydrogenase component